MCIGCDAETTLDDLVLLSLAVGSARKTDLACWGGSQWLPSFGSVRIADDWGVDRFGK
jgi:hypothetical protein